jgi:ATP-dependent DNA ligase
METLYNISPSTHKIKQWKIYVKENKIIIEHGFLDSKQVIHEQICEGKNIGKKNETTPNEQAQLEAKSQWEKKLKSGYVTYDNIKDTSKHPTYFPMLATEFSDKIEKYPCYAQPKLDGIRCIVFKYNNDIVFQSRNNTIFQNFPHLLMELNLLFLKNPNLILDGELYHHELGFQKITSIVRKKEHPELSKIQYHIYDLIDTSKTFEERYQQLSSYLKTSISILLVNTTLISSRKDMNSLHQTFINKGYEGIMLRNPHGLYKQQIRSKDLIKYKLFKDSDFIIVGHHEGSGGVPVFECITSENKKFSVNMKCSIEEKREMMENISQYYGNKLIVKYQELSEDGIPRFPVGLGIRAD